MMYSLECKCQLHHSDTKYYLRIHQPRRHEFHYLSSLVWTTPHLIQSVLSCDQSNLFLFNRYRCTYCSGSILPLVSESDFLKCHYPLLPMPKVRGLQMKPRKCNQSILNFIVMLKCVSLNNIIGVTNIYLLLFTAWFRAQR